jgi:hypothetical protein
LREGRKREYFRGIKRQEWRKSSIPRQAASCRVNNSQCRQGRHLASYDVSLSDEQANRIEEAGRPLAIHPFRYRAQLGMDRPGPAEKDCVRGWRKAQGLDPA